MLIVISASLVSIASSLLIFSMERSHNTQYIRLGEYHIWRESNNECKHALSLASIVNVFMLCGSPFNLNLCFCTCVVMNKLPSEAYLFKHTIVLANNNKHTQKRDKQFQSHPPFPTPKTKQKRINKFQNVNLLFRQSLTLGGLSSRLLTPFGKCYTPKSLNPLNTLCFERFSAFLRFPQKATM